MASRYDDELWQLVPEDAEPPPAPLVRFVRSLGERESALDLGCGDGRLTAELSARELTAADVSPVALERARRRLPASARLVELEPDAPLPLGDSRFDLVPDESGVTGALSRMLAVAYTAMADDTWQRLKACRYDSCHWAFYDHSKNRSRSWCSMKVCGNRAKARAYRERRRGD